MDIKKLEKIFEDKDLLREFKIIASIYGEDYINEGIVTGTVKAGAALVAGVAGLKGISAAANRCMSSCITAAGGGVASHMIGKKRKSCKIQCQLKMNNDMIRIYQNVARQRHAAGMPPDKALKKVKKLQDKVAKLRVQLVNIGKGAGAPTQ